ncbi:MAG: DNA-binding protein [Chloroflexia bacterium]|nr:DNA-binding protein [Chloroflexia bacterium]
MNMLELLLELLRQDQPRTVAELAQELQTTPAMVELMLEDLAQRGYLQEIGGNCQQRCQSCPLGGICAAAGARKIWALRDGK